MKNSFFLVIPTQTKESNRLVAYEKQAVVQWIAELPAANYSLMTRLLFDFIDEFITLEMPAQQRLDIAELLRPLYLSIEEGLRTRLIKTGFPKSKNERKILDLLVSLEKNFTISYWIVTKELTKRSFSWLQGKNVALAIQRTMKGLNSIIVSQYMMFLKVPDWIWIDLHSLHKLAVNHSKESTKVPDESNLFAQMESIDDCYKQILLLSLSDPSGLMQKEIKNIYHFIEKLAPYIQIEKQTIKRKKHQCLLLMDEDIAPYFIDENGTIDPSANYLNLNKLYKELKNKDDYITENNSRFSSMNVFANRGEKVSPSLFFYLRQCWQGHQIHGSILFEDRLDCYINIGLDTTYSLTNSNNSLSQSESEFLARSFSDNALSCDFHTNGTLSIGSLISFRKTKQPQNQRNLSIVKKITMPKQNNLIIFELEALTSKTYAVDYEKINRDSGDFIGKSKALLYINEGKSFIIIESFAYRDDDVMRLYMSGGNFPIILGNKKNIGLGYFQFECRQIEEKISSHQGTEKKKGYDFF